METRSETRLRCWESVFPPGQIEGPCPVCQCSLIRYGNTSGSTFQQMHIISTRHGGSDQSWNLLPGCGCNQRMRQWHLIDWMGTQGNKRSLLKGLFMAKYKSLVAPYHRSTHNHTQLIEWVRTTYAPQQLDDYKDWLILLDSDLRQIQSDHYPAAVEAVVESERRVSPHFLRPKSSKLYLQMRARLKRRQFHATYFMRPCHRPIQYKITSSSVS